MESQITWELLQKQKVNKKFSKSRCIKKYNRSWEKARKGKQSNHVGKRIVVTPVFSIKDKTEKWNQVWNNNLELFVQQKHPSCIE